MTDEKPDAVVGEMDQPQASDSQCPVDHGRIPPVEGNANQEWWPRGLNLQILYRNAPQANPDPDGKAGDWAPIPRAEEERRDDARGRSAALVVEGSLQIAAAVEHADDCHRFRLHDEGDRDATLEPDRAEARPQSAAIGAAHREINKTGAARLDARHVRGGSRRARPLGDACGKSAEVSPRLGQEVEPPRHSRRSSTVPPCSARSSAKTSSAGIARLGSAFQAS